MFFLFALTRANSWEIHISVLSPTKKLTRLDEDGQICHDRLKISHVNHVSYPLLENY